MLFTTTLLSLTAILGIASAQSSEGSGGTVAFAVHTYDTEYQNIKVKLGSDGRGKMRFKNIETYLNVPAELRIHSASVQCAPPDTECELRTIQDKAIYGWTFDECSSFTNQKGVPRIIGVECYKKGSNSITD